MLTHIQWIPLILFAISMMGSPGPNNVMVTASGANYGYKRSLPHILGIAGGGFALYALVGLGLGQLLTAYPALGWFLKIAGSAYLLYLAWRIGTAPPPAIASGVTASGVIASSLNSDSKDTGKPFTFIEAALFQFSNPKAWVFGIALMASFLPAESPAWAYALLLAAVCAGVGIACVSMWALFGAAIGRMIKTARGWRVFNTIMGLLTAACVVFILV